MARKYEPFQGGFAWPASGARKQLLSPATTRLSVLFRPTQNGNTNSKTPFLSEALDCWLII